MIFTRLLATYIDITISPHQFTILTRCKLLDSPEALAEVTLIHKPAVIAYLRHTFLGRCKRMSSPAHAHVCDRHTARSARHQHCSRRTYHPPNTCAPSPQK